MRRTTLQGRDHCNGYECRIELCEQKRSHTQEQGVVSEKSEGLHWAVFAHNIEASLALRVAGPGYRARLRSIIVPS